MTKNVEGRCVLLGEYITKNKATVRQAAKVFGVSKSTVHIDVTKRLSQTSPILAGKVAEVLKENKEQRQYKRRSSHQRKIQEVKQVILCLSDLSDAEIWQVLYFRDF